MVAASGEFYGKKEVFQKLVVWDTEKGNVLWSWQDEKYGFDAGIAFSPDSKVIATAIYRVVPDKLGGSWLFVGDGVHRWDAATGKE